MLSSQQLTELWHQHAAALLLMARGRCSAPEDCVQEAFIRLAGQDPAPDLPLAWLYRVVRNETNQVRSHERRCVREHRAAEARRTWFEQTASTAQDIDPDQVQTALMQLDNDTRDVMTASIWSGMTFQEISDAFGISKAAAHRKYQRGLSELQRLLSVTEMDRIHHGKSF